MPVFRKSGEHLITLSGNNRILSGNNLFLYIFAGLLEIFGKNTTSDISKLLYLIPRAIRLVKFGFLVSKETVVLRRWERSKQKFGFIKRVDKG